MGKWLERYRWILFSALMVLLVVAVGLFQAGRPAPETIILSTSTPLPSPESSPTPQPLQVYVSGEVQRPDVYVLAPGSIVKDAVMAAGGPTQDADLDRINLASSVGGGQHIHVPRVGEELSPIPSPAGRLPTSGGVNINTADLATLESLPGIGPALAQRILDFRQSHGPFDRIEEIMEVSGIGAGTFEKIRDLIATE